jgi:hypothetical protein
MRRFCSIFSQLLQLLPREQFQRAVRETQAERHARGFTCWEQMVALLFCQLAGAHSLREICMGLGSCEGKLNHLGVRGAPAHSTLAYANAHRPWQLYQRLFGELLTRCQGEVAQRSGGRHRFRFKNKLVSLDASVIELCLEMFDWAKYKRTKGAVKLHLKLDHEGYLTSYALVTTGAVHEVKVARQMRLEPGSIVVFDRGYIDWAWFWELTQAGIYFVTRLKRGTVYEVVEGHRVPQHRHVVCDQDILLSSAHGQRVYPETLRRVVVRDPESGEEWEYLTNHFELGASTVAAIYKERWQIELFFKALKQNLKIKSFLGSSLNAVQTQIWTALISLLLLRYLQLRARFGWSFSNLVALLRMNLFVHRDLHAWLNEPFAPPPDLPEPVQLRLAY